MHALRLFCDVARCRSFSQAAELHGITQSAASQRIGQLEKRLRTTLIDRSVRPLALTAAGRVFLTGAQDLVERYDRLERTVGEMGAAAADAGGARAQVIRVSAIYSAGIDLLHHVRERFEAAQQSLAVEIRYEHPEQVARAVREEQAELGILSYPRRWLGRAGMQTVALRDETMAVVCRPDHPLARLAKVHASGLGGYSMVTFDIDLPVGRRIREYLREQGAGGTEAGPSLRSQPARRTDQGDDAVRGAEVRITNVFDNIDTIKSAVAMTDQFSILPRRTVRREAAAGTLSVVQLEPALYRPIGVIFKSRGGGSQRGGGPLPAGTQAFVDFLLNDAGPHVDAPMDAGASEQQLIGARA